MKINEGYSVTTNLLSMLIFAQKLILNNPSAGADNTTPQGTNFMINT